MQGKGGWVPVGTTTAGSVLTTANWQALGVSRLSLSLSSLLMRPGYETLQKVSSLASFWGWPYEVILNATMLKAGPDGRYWVCSDYDGSRKSYTLEDLMVLIHSLHPTAVLFPSDALRQDASLCDVLADDIYPFFSPHDAPLSRRAHGIYYSYEGQKPEVQGPTYVLGDVPWETILAWSSVESSLWIESNLPALAGYEGVIYSREGYFDIKEEHCALSMLPLDVQCGCPTCTASYTQAYLHHLFLHTPLLCQRLLIQHNAFLSVIR